MNWNCIDWKAEACIIESCRERVVIFGMTENYKTE